MKLKNVQLDKAEEIFAGAFANSPDRRSTEYKRGAMAAIISHCTDIEVSKNNPYKSGTVEFDAFMAGVHEGNLIYERYVDQ